jgi:outer membrane lipoprotein-sorting protein
MIRNLPSRRRTLGLGAGLGFLFSLLAPWASNGLGGQQISALEILERVDRNMTVQTARTRARMIIHYREGDERTLEFTSWARGTDESFLEFTAPARDAGSRFLRREDAMWIFLPRVGKSIRIQGHMLRQGIMGSDFSYGDASENPSMVEDYDGVVEGEEELDGRPTYVVHLTAKRRDLSYPTRRVWVDAERWIPLREERFARSGKLLNTMVLGDARQVAGRWYPFRMEMDNALQTETWTVLEFVDLEFNLELDGDLFTLRNLEGG